MPSDKSDIEIRTATPHDATAIAEVLFSAFEAYESRYTPEAFANLPPPPPAGDKAAFILKNIKAPTVVVQGADDPLVPVESARDIATRVPNAELRIVPGIGHEIPVALIKTVADAISAAATRAQQAR